jgi:hypothetical protein
MPIWKLVHILAMFAAFGLLLVPLLLLLGVGRTGDLHAAKAIYTASKALGRLGFALFFVGLAGGFATLVTAGWSGTSPWLVATYALLLLVAVLDGIVMGAWRKRVERAFASTGPGSAWGSPAGSSPPSGSSRPSAISRWPRPRHMPPPAARRASVSSVVFSMAAVQPWWPYRPACPGRR